MGDSQPTLCGVMAFATAAAAEALRRQQAEKGKESKESRPDRQSRQSRPGEEGKEDRPGEEGKEGKENRPGKEDQKGKEGEEGRPGEERGPAESPVRFPGRLASERRTFSEFRRQLLAPRSLLLNPFPGTRRSAGPRLVVDHSACRYASLHRPRSSTRNADECYYYVDLDHVYENAETIFDDIQKVWTNTVEGIQRVINDGRVIPSEPELLLVILSPVVSASESPGSMLPFLVQHSDPFGSDENETKIIRFGGFPPRVTCAISRHEWKLFGDFLTTQPKMQSDVSISWGSVVCLASEFVAHSLYFMEWCVPADFIWTRRNTLSEGWGCDMMGRLLRTISSTLATSRRQKVSQRLIKRQRTEEELEENEAEAFVDMAPVSFDYLATEEHRRHLDLDFARDTISAALSDPHKRLALSSVLSQLNMMWETYSSHCFLAESNVWSEDKFSTVRVIGPAAQRLLQGWDYRAMMKPDVEQRMHACTPTTNEPLTFLENIRERGWKLARPPSFSFSHDGLELLETLPVAEGLSHDPCDDAVELADVAELVDVLRSSGRIAGETVQQKLPHGPLADAVREAFDSFITKQSCAFPPTSSEAKEFDAVSVGEEGVMGRGEGFSSPVDKWSEHVAFLQAHAKDPELLESEGHTDIMHETEATQASRIADGLEGQLFFIDAALSAVDMTMAERWAHARAFLE